MSGKSDFLSDELLDHVVGAAAYTAPANLFFALFTVTPADDGTGGTEVVGNGYVRKSVVNNLTEFPAASGQSKNNALVITFATASGGSWGTIVGAGVYDAVTAGNLLYVNAVTTSKSVDDGDTARFPAGSVVWTED